MLTQEGLVTVCSSSCKQSCLFPEPGPSPAHGAGLWITPVLPASPGAPSQPGTWRGGLAVGWPPHRVLRTYRRKRLVPALREISSSKWASEGESEVAQSCPTLCDLMDCSPPGSSIHGIFQARVLEWGAVSFSRTGQRDTRNTV